MPTAAAAGCMQPLRGPAYITQLPRAWRRVLGGLQASPAVAERLADQAARLQTVVEEAEGWQKA